MKILVNKMGEEEWQTVVEIPFSRIEVGDYVEVEWKNREAIIYTRINAKRTYWGKKLGKVFKLKKMWEEEKIRIICIYKKSKI